MASCSFKNHAHWNTGWLESRKNSCLFQNPWLEGSEAETVIGHFAPGLPLCWEASASHPWEQELYRLH